MEIVFINVGYGDSILIKKDNRYGLIDGGSSLKSEYVGNRISVKDFLVKENISVLDFVIITHIHEDHVCGICEILETVEVKKFYLPYIPNITDREDLKGIEDCKDNIRLYLKAVNSYKNILSFIRRKNIECLVLEKCFLFSPIEGVEIKILAPDNHKCLSYSQRLEALFVEDDIEKRLSLLKALDRDSNDVSLVMNLRYKGINCFFAADNCPRNWDDNCFLYMKNGNVLKLPHHGQLDAVNETFLKNLERVEWVVTSSSSDHRNRSCNRKIYEKMLGRKANLKFLFTDDIDYKPFFVRKGKNMDCIRLIIKNGSMEIKT